jgi:hypothetical protein
VADVPAIAHTREGEQGWGSEEGIGEQRPRDAQVDGTVRFKNGRESGEREKAVLAWWAGSDIPLCSIRHAARTRPSMDKHGPYWTQQETAEAPPLPSVPADTRTAPPPSHRSSVVCWGSRHRLIMQALAVAGSFAAQMRAGAADTASPTAGGDAASPLAMATRTATHAAMWCAGGAIVPEQKSRRRCIPASGSGAGSGSGSGQRRGRDEHPHPKRV